MLGNTQKAIQTRMNNKRRKLDHYDANDEGLQTPLYYKLAQDDAPQPSYPESALKISTVYQRAPISFRRRIRLLRLYAGSQAAELEGSFIVCDEGESSYDALSYTWGEQGDSSIRIMSEGAACDVPVTPNLAAALRQLRLRSSTRLLWVDALCIDQENITEKNFQIPKMAGIYRDARNVCIWLGEESEDSSLAFKFVSQLLNLEYFDLLLQDSRHRREWVALSALMRRPWFSRRWVIQEITFARRATLHCGKDWVKWKEFAHVVGLVGVRHHEIRRLFIEHSVLDRDSGYAANLTSLAASRLVHASRNLFHKSDDGEVLEPVLNLETLVYSLSPFQASRLHDTIYAILPLAADVRMYNNRSTPAFVSETSPGGSEDLPSDTSFGFTTREVSLAMQVITKLQKRVKLAFYPVDYNKSYFEVCRDFVAFSARRTRSLDIICRPWAPDDAGLPSWIPQLSAAAFRPGTNRTDTRVKGDTLVGSPGGVQRIYNADAGVASLWRIGSVGKSPQDDIKAKSLFVSGFMLDEIGAKTLPAQQGNIPAEWTAFGSWQDFDSLPPDHFWRTLVADRGPDGLIPPSYYQLACQHAFDKTNVGGDLVVRDLLGSGAPTIVSEFLERMQSIVFQRRLVRTRKFVLLGLAPAATKKGDIVCILYGVSVPILLRRIESSEADEKEPFYQIMGECYIHGIMNGEARQLRVEHDIPVRTTFEIR